MISCTVFAAAGSTIFGGAEKHKAAADTNNAELIAFAYAILDYVRDGDYIALSQVAHPEFGVVFSPCATVTLSTNKRFSPEQIAAFGSDTNTYVWGVHDGSGEPIEMTPSDYFSGIVFGRNYLDAPVIGVNRIVKRGNALENITEIFPDAKFVDFHIPGGEKDSAEELDWNSLRLGFEVYEDTLRLTIVIHSKWTV